MNDLDLSFVRAFLKERGGLALPPDKRYLAEARLAAVCRGLAIPSTGELVRRLRSGREPELERLVLEAMTTNETSFFRDKAVFERLRSVLLPRVVAMKAGTKRLRIWCAAASSGQEPYSVAMLLKEMEPELAGWTIDVLATDVSTAMLDRAEAGVYSAWEIQRGLPIKLLLKYFEQTGERWRISGELRNLVRFAPVNLIEPFDHLGPFDIVLCRNVLIYLEPQAKADLIQRIANVLLAEGVLLLGSSETLTGAGTVLMPDPEHPGVYTRAGGPPQGIGLPELNPYAERRAAGDG